MFIGAILDVVGIGVIPAFVATLAMPEKVMNVPVLSDVLIYFDITTSEKLVTWGTIVLIIVFFVKNIFLYTIFALQIRVTEYHRVRLSTRLFSSYVYAPWEFHLQRNSAELLRNVNTETKEIMTGVINPLLNIILYSLMTLLTAVLLLFTTPGPAVLGICLVGGASWLFLRIFKRRLKEYGIVAKKERKKNDSGH